MSEENERETFSQRVEALTAEIEPILHGHPPELQSAVIADLLATWLFGFVVVGDREATRDVRDTMLAGHLRLVTDLLELGPEREWQPTQGGLN